MKGKFVFSLPLLSSVVILLQMRTTVSTTIFKSSTEDKSTNEGTSSDGDDLMQVNLIAHPINGRQFEKLNGVASAGKLLGWKQMIPATAEMNRFKNKRDDNFGGAFGKGIGFFVGEPCLDTLQCNPILFNVYCNQSTGRCECTSDFPVNIYNRVCVKALRLGESCEFHESCRHSDSHAVCNEEELKCRCQEFFYPRIAEDGTPECIQGRAIFSPFHWLPWVTLATSLFAMGALAFGCTVLRRLSKGTTTRTQETHDETTTADVQRVTSLFDQSPTMSNIHHHHHHFHLRDHNPPSSSLQVHKKNTRSQRAAESSSIIHQRQQQQQYNRHLNKIQCDATFRCNSSEFVSPAKEVTLSPSVVPRKPIRRWSGSSIRSQSSLLSSFSFRSQSTLRNNFTSTAPASVHPLSLPALQSSTDYNNRDSRNETLTSARDDSNFILMQPNDHPLACLSVESSHNSMTTVTTASTSSSNITTVTGTVSFKPYSNSLVCKDNLQASHARASRTYSQLPYASESIELEEDLLI